MINDVTRLMETELNKFGKRMAKATPDHLTLTSFDFNHELEWVKENMKVVWGVLHRVATTKRAEKENTKKDPEMFLLIAIGQLAYSRSNQNNKLAQLFAIFFQGIGMPSRAFEILHQVRICMSQSWADNALATLSEERMQEMATDLKTFASFLSGDNINIAHRVFSQRVYNRNLFESGTAATAFITSQPPLPAAIAEEHIRKARKHRTITIDDFINSGAAERLRAFEIHHIVSILLDSYWFRHYKLRDDDALQPPAPVRLAPRGPGNKMKKYFEDALKQMGFATSLETKELASSKVVTVIGDELTHKCFRGLKRFRAGDRNGFERFDFLNESIGWFHVLMTLAQSMWQVHSGSKLGTGLARNVLLLQRIHFKGGAQDKPQKPTHRATARGKTKDGQPSDAQPNNTADIDPEIQENLSNAGAPMMSGKKAAQLSYHDLDELITQVLKAHVLNAWLRASRCDKLEDLKNWEPSPTKLVELGTKILDEFGSSKALQQTDPSAVVSKSRARRPKPKPTEGSSNESMAAEGENDDSMAVDEGLGPGTQPEPAAGSKDKSLSETAKTHQGTIFENGVRFTRDALYYYSLRLAIREGDVGRMEDLIRPLAVMFKGAGHPKYAILMAEVLQKLKNEYPAELRDFVTDYCWVVSRTGRGGTFHPVDQAQEHVNLHLKVFHVRFGSRVIRPARYRADTIHQVVHAAKGSNSSWDYLSKMSPAIPTYQSLAATMGRGFPSSQTGTSHTSPDDTLDIRLLVEQLQQDRVTDKEHSNGSHSEADPTKGLRKVTPSVDVFGEGWSALSTGKFLSDWKNRRKSIKSKSDIWDEVETTSGGIEGRSTRGSEVPPGEPETQPETDITPMMAVPPDNDEDNDSNGRIYFQEDLDGYELQDWDLGEMPEVMEHLAQVPLPGTEFDGDLDHDHDPALALARDLELFHV
ncbi:hypothetical protein FRC05_010682 [Tulasnella sp. 425]|nr:hypothetical protein FRC05_010682 [Tulasnella sp. 425]